MLKLFQNSKLTICLVLLLSTLVAYLPILWQPQNYLNQGNDLQEAFLANFVYLNHQFGLNHQIPLWNNLFFAGTPLLPDPQYTPFYPPNLIFLFVNPNQAIIPLLFLHTLLASSLFYILARQGFNFSKFTSLVLASFYVLNPKLAGFLAAGHVGLIENYAYLPLLVLSGIKLSQKPNRIWLAILSIGLAASFFTHTVMFILTLGLITGLTLILLLKRQFESAIFLSFGILLSLGLVSITLLSQLDFIPQSTRFLLLQDRDVYPKWNSLKQFLQLTFIPWSLPIGQLRLIDVEKWIGSGLALALVSLVGFLQSSSKLKIFTLLATLIIILISLNNLSPIYSLLIKQDWFVLMRVTTRIWAYLLIIILSVAGLALEKVFKSEAPRAKALDFLQRKELDTSIHPGLKSPRFSRSSNKVWKIVIVSIILLESVYLSWVRLLPTQHPDTTPAQLLSSISKDPSLFRLFCTTRCISQKYAADYNFQLLDGYNTLAQKNYVQQMWQVTQDYWNYYTLSVPPIGLYTFKQIQPDPKALAELNTKYIISPHPLTNPHFRIINTSEGYYLYVNDLWLPRFYTLNQQLQFSQTLTVIKTTPNKIVLNNTSSENTRAIFALLYNPDWQAYVDDKKTDILIRPNSLMLINLPLNSTKIELKYQPKYFSLGIIISGFSLVILAILLLPRMKLRVLKPSTSCKGKD